jgi:hypothetical protein
LPDLSRFFVVRDFPTYGGEFIVCRPVIGITYYFTDGTDVIGPSIADAIETFIGFGPPNFLTAFKQANGEDGKLTARTISRDLKKLRSSDTTLFELRYHSGDPSNIGPYGVQVLSDELDPDLPQMTNILTFQLPVEYAEESQLEKTVEFVSGLSEGLPFQSGFSGYAIAYLGAFDNWAYQLLPGFIVRYIAMDPSFTSAYLDMGGATPDPHWITLLRDDLLKPLGGRKALAQSVPDAEVREFQDRVLIRNARRPPIGDIHHGATDIGSLPDLARFMKQNRVSIAHMFSDAFTPDSWLARFDDRPSGAFEN